MLTAALPVAAGLLEEARAPFFPAAAPDALAKHGDLRNPVPALALMVSLRKIEQQNHTSARLIFLAAAAAAYPDMVSLDTNLTFSRVTGQNC